MYATVPSMPPHHAVTARLTTVRDAVRVHAAQTGGVFRRSELREWGVGDNDLEAMLRRGWWTRLHRRVYVDTDELSGAAPVARHLLMCAASIAALDGPAYAFAATAAALHELPLRAIGWMSCSSSGRGRAMDGP